MNKISIKPKYLLIVFVLINLVIGLFLFQDFGRGNDESAENRRSRLAKSIYLSESNDDPVTAYENLGLVRYYGTASTVIIRFIEMLFKSDTSNTVKHYIYFIFFQAAIIGMFLLSKQFFEEWTAFGISLIFSTQPLLFGHAFINHKDIPLLTIFLFSVVTGFQMVDNFNQGIFQMEDTSKNNTGTRKFADTLDKPQSNQTKKKFIFLFILFILLILLWARPQITNLAFNIVEYSFNNQGENLLGKLFDAVTISGSLEDYLSFTNKYVSKVYRWLIVIIPVILSAMFYYAQKNRFFSHTNLYLLLLSGAVWGFAISTRVIAIAAGGIVGIYALVKLKENSIIPLIIYSLISGIFSYLLWPFLWFFGLNGLIDALTLISDFPKTGVVLFEGKLYSPTDIPPSYLPKLMVLQFSEPVVIFTIAGLLIGVYIIYRKKMNVVKLLLVYAWFLLPLIYSIIKDTVNYSNFRQYLFVTPAMFVFTSIPIQQIASRLPKKIWVVTFYVIMIIPSILSIIQLHPYQYVYYNEFTGGVEGAYQKYELDYWQTSFKEVMNYVNDNVPAGSDILVVGNDISPKIYAKEEFNIRPSYLVPESEYINFDYALIPSKGLADQIYFPDAPVIFSVKVNNATLMVVKKITKIGN